MLADFFKNFSFSKKEPDDLYYGYYLFGLYKNKPIWDWEEWETCIPLIQPIIDLSPELPSISSAQSIPVIYGTNNDYASHNKGKLRFGKMFFTHQDNKNWTTKHAHEAGRTFFNTEIVFPNFSYCQKHKVDPDLFIVISNEKLTNAAEPKINQSIIILIRKNLVRPEKIKMIEQQIEELCEKINVVLYGQIMRPASFKSDYGYTDYLRDGSHGVVDLDHLDFSERWKNYGMKIIKRNNL